MDLIEAYYTVAADIRARAESMLTQAETLAKVADRMSEELIRKQSQSSEVSAHE